jgi:hypothetical protein
MRGYRTRVLLLLFVVAGVAGMLLDQIHVVSGVLLYRSPQLFGQPWWVGPQFGVATVAAYLGAGRFIPGATSYGRGGRGLARSGGWILGTYLATALVADWNVLLAGLLLMAWVGRVVFERGVCLRGAAYCVAVAAVGTTYEAALTASGAFQYHRPDLAGLPYWLPMLYLHAAPLGLVLARSSE